jgi:hypothetical protein
MMAGMRPEEAEQFYEEDEDPAKVFAIFDAARAQGRLGRTRPPGKYQPPDLTPMRELLGDLARDLRKLQLRDRIAVLMHQLAEAIESHSKAH